MLHILIIKKISLTPKVYYQKNNMYRKWIVVDRNVYAV